MYMISVTAITGNAPAQYVSGFAQNKPNHQPRKF